MANAGEKEEKRQNILAAIEQQVTPTQRKPKKRNPLSSAAGKAGRFIRDLVSADASKLDEGTRRNAIEALRRGFSRAGVGFKAGFEAGGADVGGIGGVGAAILGASAGQQQGARDREANRISELENFKAKTARIRAQKPSIFEQGALAGMKAGATAKARLKAEEESPFKQKERAQKAEKTRADKLAKEASALKSAETLTIRRKELELKKSANKLSKDRERRALVSVSRKARNDRVSALERSKKTAEALLARESNTSEIRNIQRKAIVNFSKELAELTGTSRPVEISKGFKIFGIGTDNGLVESPPRTEEEDAQFTALQDFFSATLAAGREHEITDPKLLKGLRRMRFLKAKGSK